MESFYTSVIRHRKKILIVFAVLCVLMLACCPLISVNYDMNDYLPEDSPSTTALTVMEEEFDGGIPNARVMLRDVTVAQALEYKDQIAAVEGVSEVQWLDDSVSVSQPLETADEQTVETYYKDGNALMLVTIDETSINQAVPAIREIIGEDNAMTGAAVSTAVATQSTISEIRKIAIFAVLFVWFILTLTTTSWAEPFIVLLGLGVAIVLNAGSNILFGEISFVTNAAGNILQLAVSLDYSVFLIHRFAECRKEQEDPELAMRDALVKSTSSILSSGLTTVIGFLALALMRFQIGPDLGLALAKGIAISLLTVFLFMPGFILLTYRLLDRTAHRAFVPTFRGLGKGIARCTLPLAAIFALIAVPAYLSSIHNSYYYGSSHIFAVGTQLGDDTADIEEVFGQKDTYVLLVPRGDTASEEALSADLKKMDEVSGIVSYVDLAGAQIPSEYLDADSLELLESENYSRMVLSVDVPYEGERTTALIDAIRECADSYYPGTYYLAGEGVSTYDLQETVTADMVKVNALAIGAVFFVLLLTVRCWSLPVILVLTIETAVWINLSFPYYRDEPLFYIAYLIISSIQLGATVDYAILFTDRYRENRQTMDKRESVVTTVSNVTASVLTSGSALAVVGFMLGMISTHELLSQLGYLLGRGSLCSLVAVLFILPGFLYLFDATFTKKKGDGTMNSSRRPKKESKRKRERRIAALLAAGTLALTSGQTAFAAQTPSEKEEVVYAMLEADGTVNGVYVVNSFSGGEIVDYGDYASVHNMTTTDEIQVQGDTIQIQSDADKVYYQGDLDTKEIPWKISIQYYMDGKEYEPEELAGMSGQFELRMHIAQNEACDDSFWEGYALQATLLLDTEKCQNIEADGATIANVASDKQLSYIFLPGREKEISVSADVTDFEMEAISINGVRLHLDVDVDDGELQEKAQQIQDSIAQLDDGADAVQDGAASLEDGTKELNSGVKTIQKALNTLSAQSDTLTSGSGKLLKALKKIQRSLKKVSIETEELSALSTASTQIKSGIQSLTGGLTTLDGQIAQYEQSLKSAGLSDASTLAEQNLQTAQALKARAAAGDAEATQLVALLNANAAYIKGSDQLIEGIDSALDSDSGALMTGALTLQSNYDTFDASIQQLVSQLSDLTKNMKQLKKGVNQLVKSDAALDDGIGEYTGALDAIAKGCKKLNQGSESLAQGAEELYDGTQSLAEGTETFSEETAGLDDKITDGIEDAVDEMTGTDVKTVSFVSDKNTNVDAVQFVIKTAAIEEQEPEQEAETEEEKSFWDKFVDIFK